MMAIFTYDLPSYRFLLAFKIVNLASFVMQRNDQVQRNITLAIGAIISLVYLGMGVFLVVVKTAVGMLNPTMQLILGIALILYGCLRAFRVYREISA